LHSIPQRSDRAQEKSRQGHEGSKVDRVKDDCHCRKRYDNAMTSLTLTAIKPDQGSTPSRRITIPVIAARTRTGTFCQNRTAR
jgi:hypothetical protein